MSIISYYKRTEKENDVDVCAEVRRITSIIAPVLMPMLEAMAELDTDDLALAA